MTEPMETEPENTEPFPTVYVLQAIKNAQQKHGLRHQNYQRYRTYCSNKIRRVRLCLNFTHHHKCTPKHKNPKFGLRPITDDVIDNVRFLEILIFEVERAWAYAMQLKYEINDDQFSRKKFHMKNKLHRAVEHALHLEQITKNHPRVDATTKLEVQAYCAYIGGVAGVESKHWKTAEDLYKKACTIYGKLTEVVDNEELIDLYNNRCKEVQPVLKLCAHFASENTDDNVSKKLKSEVETQDLNMEFDQLLVNPKRKNVKEEKSEAMEVDRENSEAVAPRLEPMPCKPVFFDLALNHIKMPDLHSRIKELSEKEKPVIKKPPKKQQQPQKSSPAAAPKKGVPVPKKEAPKEEPQQPETQEGIGSRVKNFFWGFK